VDGTDSVHLAGTSAEDAGPPTDVAIGGVDDVDDVEERYLGAGRARR